MGAIGGAHRAVEVTMPEPTPPREPGPPRREPRTEGGRRSPSDPFERLFLAEYGKVVAIAYRVLVDRGEAEDVAQEVFLDFHRRHSAEAAFAPA
jgi:hypothetical protein